VTLFRYILRQVALGVVVAVVGMFFIAIPGIAVSAVHRIGGGGMSTLLGFLPMVLVDLFPYLLPIGFLLAVVSTYGRLAAESEWTAIRMAGIHPLKSAAPALVVALACSGVLHVLVSEVSPTLTYVERVYLRDAVVKSFRSLSPGRTEISIGDFYLNAPDRDGNTFFEALIHIPASKGKEARTVLADSVTIEALEHSIRIRWSTAAPSTARATR
jgi:lipopolysaccharide export LptBFGC system permease protein LptF